MAASERLRSRLELRRSNAAVPYRNRFRERKSGKGQHGRAVTEEVAGMGECDLCATACVCDCWHDNTHECGCYD